MPQSTTRFIRNQQAIEILNFLNETCGKRYRPVEPNLRLIRARLAETDMVTCRRVILRKWREWRGTEWDKYLRPATLFGATKFHQYIGEFDDED